MRAVILFLIGAVATIGAAKAPQPKSALDILQRFATAASTDPDRALGFIAPNATFYLGDFAGPTPAKTLVMRVARCRLKAIAMQAETDGGFEVVWDCPPPADTELKRQELRIKFVVGKQITGGEGRYIGYTF